MSAIPEYEQRLDRLLDEAFHANHPAMHDYALIKMELKRLRAHPPAPQGETQPATQEGGDEDRHLSNHPQECPITGAPFFMTIEHPERGMVATYGGPFDSYTIPEKDEDGHLTRERYDHDAGAWVDGCEAIGLYVLKEEELNELNALANLAILFQEARRESAQPSPPSPSVEVGKCKGGDGCYHDPVHPGPGFAGYAVEVGDTPTSKRNRFFIDHGVIHDRQTGRHVCTGEHPDIDLPETCLLLNSLWRQAHDFPLVAPFYTKHAFSNKLEPSCLKCGQQRYRYAAIKHMELPNIYLCDQCASKPESELVEALPPSMDYWERDDIATQDVLLLIDLEVPLADIALWSDDLVQQIEHYVGAVHLHASDNDDVTVPPMPDVLKKYAPPTHQTEEG